MLSYVEKDSMHSIIMKIVIQSNHIILVLTFYYDIAIPNYEIL